MDQTILRRSWYVIIEWFLFYPHAGTSFDQTINSLQYPEFSESLTTASGYLQRSRRDTDILTKKTFGESTRATDDHRIVYDVVVVVVFFSL